MITADEILDAVRKGGIDNWKTTSKPEKQHAANTSRKREFEEAIEELYSAMYGREWKVTELIQATGMRKDSVYSRLQILTERGKVRRKKEGSVYLYYRI